MASSYEETVLLPVASYLDMCCDDEADSAGGGGDNAHAASIDLFPMAKAESVLDIAVSIERAVGSGGSSDSGSGSGSGGGGDPEALRHWSQFLRGGAGISDEDGEAAAAAVAATSPEAQVRDELLNSLVASAVASAGAAASAASISSEDDAAATLRHAVLRCLGAVLALRVQQAKRRGRGCSLVGSRLAELAPALVAAILSGDANGNDATTNNNITKQRRAAAAAATSIVRSLLPPACPREECPPVLVRDLVLMPLLLRMAESSGVGVGPVAALLAECVETTASLASTSSCGSSEKEEEEEEEMARSLRVESAVLGLMQQMKPVWTALIDATDAPDADAATGTASVVQMFRTMHRWAPHAVESQLGGGGGDADGPGGTILQQLLGEGNATHSEDSGADEPTKAAATAFATAAAPKDADGDSNPSALLPPFYAHLTDPPVIICSARELEATLGSIQDDLARGEDSEMWNLRFEALKTLERILAGGIIRITDDGAANESKQLQLRTTFLSAIRKMPIETQILDLRSQITREACRFLVALAYELRETGETDCHAAMANLADLWMPAVLRLAISGVRLMATQGMNCMMHLAALGGTYGYPRVVPVLCNGCVGKKVHQNHRRGCILALTAALRVWGGHCLERHAEVIGKAVSESACHRDPNVREEGRKAFWALHGREEFRHIAEDLLATMDVREKKRLNGAKAEADGEWEEGGRMEVLVRTGVDDAASPRAGGAKRSTGSTIGRRGAGAVAKKKTAQPAASARPSIRERMKAQAMAKARTQTNGDEDGFMVVESAKSAPQATPSMPKRTPGRKAVVSSSTTPFARGKTPRKPAVPKQTPRRRDSSSALPPKTPGRAPTSIAKSARKSRASTPGRVQTPAPASIAKSARKSRASTPGRVQTPTSGSISRQRRTSVSNFTPSSRRGIRNIEDFAEMATSDEWSQREKAFAALSAALKTSIASKTNDRRSSIGDRSPMDLATFISTNSSVEQYVGLLLDNMKEKNIRVCRSATHCCGVSLRHREMKMAIAPYLHLVIPTILNVMAKYDKGGAATDNVSDAATDCLDAISRLVIPEDMVKLFAAALANHNAASSDDLALSVGSAANPHHSLTDYAVQKLVDLLCSAISNVGGGSSIMSPSDMSAFLRELAKVVSRPSNRHTSTPQHMTRAADDKVKASVCVLSKILLEEYDACNSVQVFRMMEQDDTDALIHCIWTFGGQWGADLRERVVSTVRRGDGENNNSNSAIVEGTFGADLLCKSPTEQADLFSDLLSPKAKERTPENDPLKALAAVATPKTPALPCDIGTRLLGVDATPSSTDTGEDTTGSDIKSPLLPKKLSVDTMTSPEAENDAGVTALPNKVKTPAAKTPVATADAAKYTPYEKALRSLKKGKTPKLEFSPVRMISTPSGALNFVDRPSAMSPIITEPLREDVGALPQILAGLKNSNSPQDQYVVLQSLLKHAKNDGDDPRWETEFSSIVDCLLGKYDGCNTLGSST